MRRRSPCEIVAELENVIKHVELKSAHITLIGFFMFVIYPVRRVDSNIVVCFTSLASLESSKVYNMHRVQ